VNYLNCFEFARYDGRDVNILHFVSGETPDVTPDEPAAPQENNKNLICLDAWQFLKAAQSKVFYLLRRCKVLNDTLPDFEGEFDPQGKVAFIEAMKNYRIHLRYCWAGEKLQVQFSRVIKDKYKEYFDKAEKAKAFDRWLCNYINYLLRALQRKEACGLMELVVKQTLLLPIYSRCKTVEDVLVYTLLLNCRKWGDDSSIKIEEIPEDADESESCNCERHKPMPELNYYQRLIECCIDGDGVAWANLYSIEDKNIALGGREGARKKALEKLLSMEETMPMHAAFYGTIKYQLQSL